MFIASAAKNAVKSKVHDFIDAQITKAMRPFLMSGQGPDGKELSDIVVNEDSDISIENMFIKPDIVNENLVKASSPMRVSLVCAERIFFDIPWDNLTARDAVWKLEVEGLMILASPLERVEWDVEQLREAKESAVRAAVKSLVTKLKALDAKPKKPSFVEGIIKRLMDQVNLTVHINNVHFRLERVHGDGMPGAPPFAVGFVLPCCDVSTVVKNGEEIETTVTVEKAGIYCKAGTWCGDPVASTVVDEAALAKSAASPVAQLAESYAMRSRMADFLKETESWPESEWFVRCAGDGRAHPVALKAVVCMDGKNKASPANFDYAKPIQVVRVSIGVVAVQARDVQGAAMLSIGANASQYKLWAAYGVTKRALKLPKGKVPPRMLWRAARQAVTASLHKAKVGMTNMTELLRDAKVYRQRYVELLGACMQDGGLHASSIFSTKEVDKAIGKLLPETAKPLLATLQALEDTLPIGTLAWCRWASQTQLKKAGSHAGAKLAKRSSLYGVKEESSGRKFSLTGGGGDDDDDDDEDSEREGDGDLTRVMDAVPKVDPRIEAAPTGYVARAVDVQFGRFSLQVIRSLSDVEQAQHRAASSSAQATPSSNPGIELMQLDVNTIRTRLRSVHGTGAAMAMYITSIEAADATAPNRPLFVNMAGVDPDETDELLGGTVEYAGDISAFLEQRKKESAGIMRSIGARAYGAVAGAVTSSDGAESFNGEKRGSLPLPALMVKTLTSKADNVPNEMSMKVNLVDVHYLPPFWVALEAYLQVLERVKWSSQLGATAMLRVRHPRIYRAVDKLMREGWHTPQIKIMTPFLELSDMMGLPSWKHKLDVSMAGVAFTLMSEKEAGEEQLPIMKVTLPPINVTKSPKVGEPQPKELKFAVDFGGKIEAVSPVQKGLFTRVMMIATNGGPYKALSRLHGTRDTLAGDVIALNGKVASLQAELAKLQVAHAALHSQLVAKNLETSLLETVGTPVASEESTVLSPRGPTAQGVIAAQNEAMERQMAQMNASISQIASAMVTNKKIKRSSWLFRRSRASSSPTYPGVC